ncbi:MAG: hypothetical protein ACRDRI_12995 [Pseudonocardiaceae bacterium]
MFVDHERGIAQGKEYLFVVIDNKSNSKILPEDVLTVRRYSRMHKLKVNSKPEGEDPHGGNPQHGMIGSTEYLRCRDQARHSPLGR